MDGLYKLEIFVIQLRVLTEVCYMMAISTRCLIHEIPKNDVDVNVHPAKTIVRIAKEEIVSKRIRVVINEFG